MIEYNTKYFDEDSRRLARKLHLMKTRCYNPNYPLFKDYGGRGITICEEWLHDTYSFINWAKANGYKKGLTIDRIDNNKGYSPDNCRWVSYVVQNNNKRNNRLFTIMGVTKSVAQWLYSLKMPKWYHKEIYSEPDHVIMHILLKRVHQIITENHFENVNDINEIIRRLDK